MIHGTVELTNGEQVACYFEYSPVSVGQVMMLDSAGDYRCYEVTELLDAKPQTYRDCNTGLMREMPIYAYQLRELSAQPDSANVCESQPPSQS